MSEHRGATFVGHGGGDRGIDNYFAWYPQQQLAIAVVCNTDNTPERSQRHWTAQPSGQSSIRCATCTRGPDGRGDCLRRFRKRMPAVVEDSAGQDSLRLAQGGMG